MAKVPGIWRAKPKVSEAELQADRRRIEERLAEIFGLKFESLESAIEFGSESEPEDASAGFYLDDGAESVDDVVALPLDTALAEPGSGEEAEPPVKPVARPRPAIFVEGSRDLVPVMALGGAAPWNGGSEEDWDMVEPSPPTVGALKPEEPIALAALVVAVPAMPKVIAAPVKVVTPKAVTARAMAAKPMPVVARAKAAKPKPVTVPTKPKAVSTPAKMAAAFAPWCPSCAIPLEPVPTSSRRCAQCRERIIVKRVEGHTVFLAEAVLPVFETERRRVANASRLARECQRWLRLAAIAGAPAEKLEARARAAAARPSEEAVAASRVLYLGTVEREYQEAKRERRWEEASRIRRDHALVLHREAGSPVPPSEVALKLHRDAMAAALRGIAEMVRDAELVAAGCCDACRADDRRIVRISAELRAVSLPHAGCPKGLCGCRWDLPTRHRATVQRYARRRAAVDPRVPRDQVRSKG
jgi:hypothetical protein